MLLHIIYRYIHYLVPIKINEIGEAVVVGALRWRASFDVFGAPTRRRNASGAGARRAAGEGTPAHFPLVAAAFCHSILVLLALTCATIVWTFKIQR